MSNPITAELVERIAKARLEAQQAFIETLESKPNVSPEFFLPWDEQSPMAKHRRREAVLNQLNEIVPHLIEAGWTPPKDGAK